MPIVAMTLRLADDEAAALCRRAEAERRIDAGGRTGRGAGVRGATRADDDVDEIASRIDAVYSEPDRVIVTRSRLYLQTESIGHGLSGARPMAWWPLSAPAPANRTSTSRIDPVAAVPRPAVGPRTTRLYERRAASRLASAGPEEKTLSPERAPCSEPGTHAASPC